MSKDDRGHAWTEVKDTRMRYEKSHPWSFSEPIGVNLEGGCDCPRNAFGFKAGCPHLGNKRKYYGKPKAHGLKGF